MNGLRLEHMEASDMLDVIHFFFEESINFSTAEQAKSVDAIRTKIYSDMYNQKYRYGSGVNDGFNTNGAAGFDFEEEENPVVEEVNPFNPRHKVPAKAFVPATEFSDDDDEKPFGKLLDAPIS